MLNISYWQVPDVDELVGESLGKPSGDPTGDDAGPLAAAPNWSKATNVKPIIAKFYCHLIRAELGFMEWGMIYLFIIIIIIIILH